MVEHLPGCSNQMPVWLISCSHAIINGRPVKQLQLMGSSTLIGAACSGIEPQGQSGALSMSWFYGLESSQKAYWAYSITSMTHFHLIWMRSWSIILHMTSTIPKNRLLSFNYLMKLGSHMKRKNKNLDNP